ncbi:hypothetical protein BDK92_4296 [Micromonospora pisi]|uniref:Uncharacterized protein n=1 Tax=Micromonospora pisi TaxID=589240 RepID=A0A495JMQ3_9ACTN|nr:hypothetical protein BDK92_4296 [Micromonospora pisi]
MNRTSTKGPSPWSGTSSPPATGSSRAHPRPPPAAAPPPWTNARSRSGVLTAEQDDQLQCLAKKQVAERQDHDGHHDTVHRSHGGQIAVQRPWPSFRTVESYGRPRLRAAPKAATLMDAMAVTPATPDDVCDAKATIIAAGIPAQAVTIQAPTAHGLSLEADAGACSSWRRLMVGNHRGLSGTSDKGHGPTGPVGAPQDQLWNKLSYPRRCPVTWEKPYRHTESATSFVATFDCDQALTCVKRGRTGCSKHIRQVQPGGPDPCGSRNNVRPVQRPSRSHARPR